MEENEKEKGGGVRRSSVNDHTMFHEMKKVGSVMSGMGSVEEYIITSFYEEVAKITPDRIERITANLNDLKIKSASQSVTV